MRKKTWVVLSLVLMLILQMLNFNTEVRAENQVKLSSRVDVFSTDTGYRFQVIYNINNLTDKDISRVRVTEQLLDANKQPVGSSHVTVMEKSVPAGESISFAGEEQNAIIGYIRYSVEYQVQGEDQWISLYQGEESLININITVNYKANVSGKVKKNEEVQYTAVVESASNVALLDVVLIDSKLGEIGRIPVLGPGDKKTLTRYFKLQGTTESHAILQYMDPTGERDEIVQELPNTKVKVEVQEQEPVYSLEMTGSVDKSHISSDEEVAIRLQIKNTGNVALNNVQCSDWNGNVFFEIVQLLPGQETKAEYKARISPDKEYKIVCSGTPEDGAQKVTATYNFTVKKAQANVEIIRDFEPEEAAPGDIVTLNYTIKNTGNIALVDVVVDEPELGNVASFDKLAPGEEKTFTVQEEMDEDGIVSKTVVTAKDESTGESYRFEADEWFIPAVGSGRNPHLSIDVTFDPPSLEEAGSVKVTCVIKNDGDVVLSNLEVFIKERNIPMGSVLTLSPGQEETFTLSHLGVEETETFTVLVKAEDPEGNALEFTSQPFEITVGLQESQEGGRDSEGKITLLKTVLIVVIFLIVLIAGALLYIVRDSLPFFRKRKTLKPKAPSQQ